MKNENSGRRKFLKIGGSLALGSAALLALGKTGFANSKDGVDMDAFSSAGDGVDQFQLGVLPYTYDSLEPFIDKLTMEIHYSKHHQAYVTNLNKAIKGIHFHSLEELLNGVSAYSSAVRNNAGGHYNHSMYWAIMKPKGGGMPKGLLQAEITKKFGSFESFKETFHSSAMSIFGSGWAWLVINNAGELEIGTTPNQDNPLMDVSKLRGFPVMGIDIWEHAYYLKHQNKRADYIKDWWNVLNWDEIERRFTEKK